MATTVPPSQNSRVLQGIVQNGFLDGGEDETNIGCVRCLRETVFSNPPPLHGQILKDEKK